MEAQGGIELRYRSEVGQSLHEPRPQFIVMNKMRAELDYLLSGYLDTDAARSAIEGAVETLTEGARVARTWLAGHPSGSAGGGVGYHLRYEGADVV